MIELVAAVVAVAILSIFIIRRMLSPSLPRFNPTPVTQLVIRRRVGVSTMPSVVSLAALKKLGVTRVRFSLLWSLYLDSRTWAADRVTEDPSGKTNAQWFAVDMGTLAAAGLNILVVVHTPPVGMDLATGITAMPTFMATLAAAFPGVAWEILNEPNTEDAFNGGWFSASDGGVTDTTRGDRYGSLIGPVYDAIKAADATATVITGGTGAPQMGFYAGLAATAPGKFDAFGIHAYGPPALTNFVVLAELMATAAPSLPRWCTEWGNGATDESTQAADIGKCLDENDRNARYAEIYLYTMLPDGLGYNIVRSDGSWRQAALLIPNRTAP